MSLEEGPVNSLLHVLVKLGSSFPGNLVESLLLLNTFLVHLLPAQNVLDIIIRRIDVVMVKELLHRLGVGDLRILQQRPEIGA